MSKVKKQTGRMLNYYANHFLDYRVRAHFQRAFKKEVASLQNDWPSMIKTDNPPLIILGMHRSGTTLMSRLLRDAGLFMGWLRGYETDESLFFQTTNRAILRLAESAWDMPEDFIEGVKDKDFLHRICDITYKYCQTPSKTGAYFGPKGGRPRSFYAQSGAWGWKDPRTCITLPVWMQLIPNARILYVYRNAVDVANSLVVRNKKYINNKAYSKQCESLEGAFYLWEVYNQQCLSNVKRLSSGQFFQVKYEDLLKSPDEILPNVLDFAGIQLSDERLSVLVDSIDAKRAYAFESDPELLSFYHKIEDNLLMKRLGYSNIQMKQG